MKQVILDCSGVQSEADFWSLYVEVVKPDGGEFFGHNLDAFWDAVAGGGPGSPGECELRLTHTGTLAALREGAFVRSLTQIAAASLLVRLTIE